MSEVLDQTKKNQNQKNQIRTKVSEFQDGSKESNFSVCSTRDEERGNINTLQGQEIK